MPRQQEPPRIKRAGNGFYYVHWNDGSRSRRESLETKDQTEAGDRFAYWLIEQRKPSGEPLKIRVLNQAYDDEHLVAAADPERQRQRLAFINAHFGDFTTDQLEPRVFKEYQNRRPVSASTVRGELEILRASLNHNRRAGRLSDVPHIPMPPKGAPRDRWLSADEIELLLDKARSRAGDELSRVERFTWLALECAQRKRAIELLTWDRVNLSAGQIDFRIPGKQITKKRQSVVPISTRLYPVLEQARREASSDWVLDNDGNIRKSFENLAIAAGMPDVTPHVLRHTAATHMARSGVSLWHIAGILGNTLAMVEQTYAHHCPDTLRKAVDYDRA